MKSQDRYLYSFMYGFGLWLLLLYTEYSRKGEIAT